MYFSLLLCALYFVSKHYRLFYHYRNDHQFIRKLTFAIKFFIIRVTYGYRAL